jgi:hypothetical protein
MKVQIKKEELVENKIYFEIEPIEQEKKNFFLFGKEVFFDNDQTKINEERVKALEEANNEFLKLE